MVKKDVGLNSNVTNALNVIAKKLEGRGLKWSIMCSCALFLHGIEVDPCDIDILVDREGGYLLNEILKEYTTAPAKYDPDPEAFDSYSLARFSIEGVPVEVISDFKYKSRLDNKWYCANDMLMSPVVIHINGAQVPVVDLKLMRQAYERFGRAKDTQKLQMLRSIA